jgi:hypothetical protein
MTPSNASTRARHRIGGYRVIAPIGAGGFATVYRALDEKTGREVAIKVLAENHSLVPDTRRRFVDEVGLLATIDSAAIAKIYEVGETDTKQPFMVLELADRGDLRRRLEEVRGSHRVLNRSDLTMLAHHLYEALSTLHDAEIVHRDVSPGNILIKSRRASGRRIPTGEGGVALLEPGERLLLADLGHAKDMILASGFTAGGGTRGFASPEQRDDVTVVDHRADIFSATAVIEWAAHDGKYGEDLEPFFDIGLAAEPDDRFDSMAEWHAAFCAALGAHGNGQQKGGLFRRNRSKSGQSPERISRRGVLIGATATAAVAMVALVGASQLDPDVATNTSVEAVAAAGPTSLPIEEAPGLLRVKAESTEGGDATDGAATTEEASTTTEVPPDATTTVETVTTIGETTVTEPDPTPTVTETTATMPPDSETTVDEFTNSPLADFTSPADGTSVDGDLTIVGQATFPGGLKHVEVVVKNLTTGLHWNPEIDEFQIDWLRFPVLIDGPDNTDTSWTFTIPDAELAPGEYLIRAWARGVNGEGDPRSASTNIRVN